MMVIINLLLLLTTTTQEAIFSLITDAQNVLRCMINRKGDSKDKVRCQIQIIIIFGVPSVVIIAAWELIKDFVNDDVERYHILWSLIFLKVPLNVMPGPNRGFQVDGTKHWDKLYSKKAKICIKGKARDCFLLLEAVQYYLDTHLHHSGFNNEEMMRK